MRRFAAGLLLFAACKAYSGDDAVASPDAGSSSMPDADVADASADGAPAGPACDPTVGCISVPDGWEVVALTDSFGDAGAPSAAACPPNWTDHRRLRANPRVSGNQCSCSCGAPTGNPCLRDAATSSLVVKTDTAASATCDSQRVIYADGGCRRITWSKSITHAGGLANYTPATLPCAAQGALPPVTDDGAAWACASPPPGPCPEGLGRCVTKPAGANICYLHAGEVDCPGAGQTRRVVVLDTGVTDERTCPCACTTTAATCLNEHITLYTDQQCTENRGDVILDGTCRVTPHLTFDAVSYIYTATPSSNACVVSSSTVTATGGLKLESQTLCCD